MSPQASPSGMTGSADGRDAPSTIVMEVLSPDGCGRIASGCQTEGGGIEGVAVRALDTLRAEGTTGGITSRAPGPLPPCPVPRAADTAVALVANLGSATCTKGCAGGTSVDGRARAIISAAIHATPAPATANPYTITAI